MDLSNLKPAEGAIKPRKRIGRGTGSGWGKTAGKGQKGQKARGKGKVSPAFEGGQMPLQRRIPKRGFVNNFATEYSVVNLEDLEQYFQAGDTVDVDTLADCGLIWSRWVRPGEGRDRVRETRLVKVLARGELTKGLTVKAHKFSQSAAGAISAAGGTAEVI
jgi:large subunit ribosomal protein L15